MSALFILALIIAVAKLWSDIRSLRVRVQALEWGRTPQAAAEPWLRHHDYPLPEQWQSPTAPAPTPEPAAPQPHARVADIPVRAQPAEAPFLLESSSTDDPGEIFDTSVPPARPAFSFEDIFGRKLPIWAGGVTLAVCGLLIVKYSIEAGLISPIIRVIGGLLFGSGLIAGAEAARQNESRVRDARVAQALSGAGVATLYATTLVAANLYHLIPPLAAFLFMAATTVLAGALSIRFGAPSAVLGLLGGLAAPALVGSGTPNVPLLAAYLSLAVGGLATLGRAQRWWWLGVAALAGGFGWALILILNGALNLADSLSVGAFLLLLGIGLPVLVFGGGKGVVVRLAGTLVATAQLAALVATGGFAMLHWGLFGLLGVASVWLSRREKPLADLPAPALVTALLLMAAWPDAGARASLPLVLGGALAIFGIPAVWRLWRADGRLSDAAGAALLAAAPLALGLWHFPLNDHGAALLAILGAGAAALVAAMGWRSITRCDDSRFAVLTGTAGVLAMVAAPFALIAWSVAPVWAVVAVVLLLVGRAAADRRVEGVAWAAGTATVLLLVVAPDGPGDALLRPSGLVRGASGVLALSWGIAAIAALAFARFAKGAAAEPIASAAAVLLGYVALAQVVPPVLIPLLPVAAVATLGWFRRSDSATITAAALAACWAAWPLAQWLAIGGGALLGFWAHADALPALTDTATRLLAPASAAALVLWRHPPAYRPRRHAGWATVALLATAAAHVAYKHLFALATPDRFVALGMAERTLWEALLTLAAAAIWHRWPDAARALGLAALAHFAWFTLLLHDPLWTEQAVGALPVANLVLPAYGLAFALLYAAGRIGLPPLAERARGWAQMLLIGLFAASELRQLVHGALLTGGGLGQAEDIARSIVAVGVAVGFLLWGIRRANRDWRIASLIVMLGAVLKVFLLDTSGLDGLLRIASFAALGFSLIGIGWLYSRFLPDSAAAVNPLSAALV